VGVRAIASIAVATTFPCGLLVDCAGMAVHVMFTSWTLAIASLVLCKCLGISPAWFSSDLVNPGTGLSNTGPLDSGLVPCQFVVEHIAEWIYQVIEKIEQRMGLESGGVDRLGVHA
jgi:hypothetical protein